MLRTLLIAALALTPGLAFPAASDPVEDEFPVARYGDIVLAEEEASLDLEADVGTLWTLALAQLGDAGALLPEHVLADTWLVVDDLWLRLESLPYKSGDWTRVRVRVDGFDRVADVVAAERFLVEMAHGLEDLRSEQARALEAERRGSGPGADGEAPLRFSDRADIASVPGFSLWVPFHAMLAWALAGWVDMTAAWYVNPPWDPDPWGSPGVWFGPSDAGWPDGPVFAGGGGVPGGLGEPPADDGLPPDGGGGDDGGGGVDGGGVDGGGDRPPLNPPIAFGGSLGSRLGDHGATTQVGRRGAAGPATVSAARSGALVGTVPSRTLASLDMGGLPAGVWIPRGSGPDGSSSAGSSPTGPSSSGVGGGPGGSWGSSSTGSDDAASSSGAPSLDRSDDHGHRGRAPTLSTASAVVRRSLSTPVTGGGLLFSRREALVTPASSRDRPSLLSSSRGSVSASGSVSSSSRSGRQGAARPSISSVRSSPRAAISGGLTSRPSAAPDLSRRVSPAPVSRSTPRATSPRSGGSKSSAGARSSAKAPGVKTTSRKGAGKGRP